MPTTLTHAEQFFYDHAGYWHTKTETEEAGHIRCARHLAAAEAYARSQGYYYSWESDPDGCIGCTCGSSECPCSTGEPHEVLYCQLYDADDNFITSLSGICEPTAEYRRVIEAELATEVFEPIPQQPKGE